MSSISQSEGGIDLDSQSEIEAQFETQPKIFPSYSNIYYWLNVQQKWIVNIG